MKALRLAGTGWLLLALAVPAQAQKDKKNDKKPGEVVDAEKGLKPGQITGKLVSATETALMLRIEYQHLELKDPKGGQRPNPGNNPQLQQLLRQQQEMARARERLARARNQQEAYRIMQDLQRQAQQAQLNAMRQQLQGAGGKGGQQSPFKVVTESKDFAIDLDDSAQVRTSFLPFQYDEMGNPKKYTPEEMKELKGKGNLPGYTAKATDLKAGQEVTVTLARNKETENKLRGVMVLITKESDQPLKQEKPKKKNK